MDAPKAGGRRVWLILALLQLWIPVYNEQAKSGDIAISTSRSTTPKRRLLGPLSLTGGAQDEAIRYAVSVTAAVAALFLRELLNPIFGGHNPYHTVWLAVVFSAWYCGFGPAVVATLLTVLGVWYWFLPPFHSFAPKNGTEIWGALGYVIFSGVIILLGESSRRVVSQLRRAEDRLSKAQDELEENVKARTKELERTAAEVLEKAFFLDSVNDAIFVRSAEDTITFWNRGAERLYGWTKSEAVGRSPHELVKTEFPVPLEEIKARDQWDGELLHTKRDGTRITVASRWTTVRDDHGKPLGWLEINTDITARREAERAARRLSGRILSIRDDERRRIARALHDSLGQYLTALKINVDVLSNSSDTSTRVAEECSTILEKCLSEVRTISHLLHPPLLDEAGLASAVRWYVTGFAERSGITVSLDLPNELRRLDAETEIALFRAVQECLTNVHRHSGGSTVDVRLSFDTNQIQLEIEDNGSGMSSNRLRDIMKGSSQAGVGIAGMRERMRELGGSLEIHSGDSGTKVVIKTPRIEPTPVAVTDAEAERNVPAA